MKLEIIRCDSCKKETNAHSPLPPEWFTVSRGAHLHATGGFVNTPILLDGKPISSTKQPELIFTHRQDQHFCSEDCFRAYFQMPASHPEVPQQAECKARRFLLVDGETADIIEGVQWWNGSVALETEIPVPGQADSSDFRNWEEFKAANEGSGVQWIDQETKKEASA